MISLLDISFINSSFSNCIENNYSFALWRLPHQHEYQLIINKKKNIKTKPIFNELKSGFVISPFINPHLKETIFIEAEQYFTFNELNKEEEIHFENDKQKLDIKTINEISEHDFKQIVADGISLIKDKHLHKIVFSRAKTVDYPENFHPINHFLDLCKAYENTFVSLTFTPEFGLWLGATPESLLSLNENGILKTVALAGTQNFDPEVCPKQAIWRQKEIEEQALVCRYIINCFKKVRVREYEEIGPKTIVAGNLMHLKTDFTVDTVEIDYPHLGTTMLELLHPTSAVCGMPKDFAIETILAKENYNREIFSGFIGPVNINECSDIFVNIRCMQLSKDKAIVYAGAGITEDSIPQNEWQETEMKMKTILLR